MIDDGYFPRGESLLREVHEERAVGLFYGQRALGIGAIAPLNFIGTLRHTRALGSPFQRLTRTATMFETIFFGSRAEADGVLATVQRLHERVQGELPADAGPFPAGSPYSAFDPELMLWTVAVAADSAQHFYELFVRRLSQDERERLWQEYIRFGELFGMPRAVAPPTYPDFRAYWNERLASDESYLTDEARYVGSAIMFQIPVPLSRWPAMRLHNLIMLGSLPERVRHLYGLSWSPAQALAYRAAVAALRAPRPLVPARLRRGSCRGEFDLVARTERARLARGAEIPGALVEAAGQAGTAAPTAPSARRA
jgi:uncharacterized protein (DUF2236 family)